MDLLPPSVTIVSIRVSIACSRPDLCSLFVRLRVMSVLGGFVITKADIFPAAAARGAGQIALVSNMNVFFVRGFVCNLHSTPEYHDAMPHVFENGPRILLKQYQRLRCAQSRLGFTAHLLPVKLTPVLRCLILFHSRTSVYNRRYLPVYGYRPGLADKAVLLGSTSFPPWYACCRWMGKLW